KDVSGIAVSLLELPALLERADVVLCSTASQQPLVTRDLVARVIKARRYRPLFLIDLALPRNVDPAVNQLENVYVYDMDDLERLAAQNRGLREQEMQRAEAIVRDGRTRGVRARGFGGGGGCRVQSGRPPPDATEVSALRIGTRKSPLALWQAEHVRDLLAARGEAAELVRITTTGDRILDRPLAE